jgi:hypothetical protein
MTPLFRVEVSGELEPDCLDQKVVIFHGINKSGSMCFANVLRTTYIVAVRREQFYCQYHKPRVEWPELLRRVEDSTPHALFISHNLYGAVKTKPHHTFVTMFRHPLPRIVSGYQWLKNRFVSEGGKAEEFQTLEEFVEKGNGITWSQIAQFGIGFDPEVRKKKWRYSAEQTYQWCVENIERDVSWFGIAELFEESIFVFASLCGLSRVTAWKRDVRNPGRALASELSPSTQEMIRHFYRYDFELYERMLALFRQRLDRLELKGDFDSYKSVCAGEYKERLLDKQPMSEQCHP